MWIRQCLPGTLDVVISTVRLSKLLCFVLCTKLVPDGITSHNPGKLFIKKILPSNARFQLSKCQCQPVNQSTSLQSFTRNGTQAFMDVKFQAEDHAFSVKEAQVLDVG